MHLFYDTFATLFEDHKANDWEREIEKEIDREGVSLWKVWQLYAFKLPEMKAQKEDTRQ